MPWHKDSDHPECPGGIAVVKDDDGSVVGCHKGEDADEKADRQLAALYASEEEAKSHTLAGGHGVTKAGRVLSAANAEAIVGAVVGLVEVLERAGIDVPGFPSPDGTGSGPSPGDEGEMEDGEHMDEKSFSQFRAIKEASFGERQRHISSAWYERFRAKLPPGVEFEYWVDEVYEDRVIVKGPEGMWQYPYEVDEDGEVTFGDPARVEVQYVVVGEQAEGAPMRHALLPHLLEQEQHLLGVKFLGETDEHYTIGGYGIVWGSENQRDLSPWRNADGSHGEFFTPNTQWLDDLPVKVITWEHGFEEDPDGEPLKEAIGFSVKEQDDRVGRWVEAQIDKAKEYAEAVIDLVRRRVLNFSSETANHWREVAENGEIKSWRTAGYSLTTHPMEPRFTDVGELKSLFEQAGIKWHPEHAGADGGEPGSPQGRERDGAAGETALALERERMRTLELD